jgi:hypothetical protein
MLQAMSSSQAQAAVQHFLHTCIPPRIKSASSTITSALTAVRSSYQLCSPQALHARLAALGQFRPLEEPITGADLEGCCQGIPRALLCWDGPDEVVRRLVAWIRNGHWAEGEGSVTALHCAKLAQLPEEEQMAVLQHFRRLAGKRGWEDGEGVLVSLFVSVHRNHQVQWQQEQESSEAEEEWA